LADDTRPWPACPAGYVDAVDLRKDGTHTFADKY
jgi:hypothetical protein